MKKFLKENIIKNISIAILLILFYFPIQNYVSETSTANPAVAGDFLLFVSLVLVTACFGNFAFTYSEVKQKNVIQRYLAHAVTGTLTLLIGMSLIFSATLIKSLTTPFILIDAMLLLLYLACVGYDTWDFLRIQ